MMIANGGNTTNDTGALYKRTPWRKELDEAKLDMGLMVPFSKERLNQSLVSAVLENNYRAVREMVAMGADQNFYPDASYWGVSHQEHSDRFIEDRGCLLHVAVRLGGLKTVIALLHAGADPFVRDAAGLTPRALAQQLAARDGYSAVYSRMKTVLKIWEQRRRDAVNDDLPHVILDRPYRETA